MHNITELKKRIEEEYGNTTGIVIWRKGSIVYEEYFHSCTRNSTVHMYSVTKSMISILIGIALDKGYIKSIDQHIIDFFPERKPDKDDVIQNITIKDMLTMTAPYRFEAEDYEAYFTSGSYAAYALEQLGGTSSIGTFRYTPIIGPDILSWILVKAVGCSVLDFAREHLFTPLDIHVEKDIVFQNAQEQLAFQQSHTISGWVMDSKGVHTAGWGLSLSAMDMAKLGQLYLQQGAWKGNQIVSAAWIHESTIEHSRWPALDLAYGYLWWVWEQGFAAMGDGGNVIYVNKKTQTVISIASLFAEDVADRMELIVTYIEPMLQD